MKKTWLSFYASIIFLVLPRVVSSQQFISDNYLAMPYGVATFCVTMGTENALLLPSFSLARNWEFFIGANVFWEDKEREIEANYQTILNAKYMIYENDTKDGGLGLTFGTGGFPAYRWQNVRIESFKNAYAIFQVTLPFLDGMFSWDLNPGVVMDWRGGEDQDQLEAGFTYASRLAVYKIIPRTAIVGEIFGTEGGISAALAYNVGFRWEPYEQINVTLTYGNATDGSRGPGLQLGMLLYAPKFLCKGCRGKIYD